MATENSTIKSLEEEVSTISFKSNLSTSSKNDEKLSSVKKSNNQRSKGEKINLRPKALEKNSWDFGSKKPIESKFPQNKIGSFLKTFEPKFGKLTSKPQTLKKQNFY